MTKTSKKPRSGDRTIIEIKRHDGTVTARIPGYWIYGADGQLVQVTIPQD